MEGETVLNLGAGVEKAFVAKTTDPLILPQPYASPADFAAQYPTPLDPTEIIAMCEEVTALQAIPEQVTALKSHTWRELTTLAFTSGSAYLAFADGECPEEYTHNGSNQTVDIKNIGAKKSLSVRDIRHSTAVAAANWNGINTLVGGIPAGEGLPGASDLGTFQREVVQGVKAKEIRLAMTLVLNGEDKLLITGDHVANALAFTGIEQWATRYSCTMHTNSNTASGTFASTDFDRYLSEACAKPTHLFGHPQAIQEVMLSYFSLGFQGSQIINYANGSRITPGFNFGGVVNTGIGALTVVADTNFTKTNFGSATAFQAKIWALRMTHNGEPLVYRITQIPLSYVDLVPGCTAVSFEIWKATALVIKYCCAQGAYTSQFSGRYSVSTCTSIG